ncbi:MAG: hypothetical protein PGN11_14330 [Quadrisphaera sp.]
MSSTVSSSTRGGVLDAAGPGAHGALQPAGAVGVGRHVAAAVGGDLDDGAQLRLAQLRRLDGVAVRQQPAGGEDLDLGGAAVELRAGGARGGVGPVHQEHREG